MTNARSIDSVDLRDAPLTAKLVARHEAETLALDSRFPDNGNIATRHEWREHSLRQARELLEHAAAMESMWKEAANVLRGLIG